MQILLTEAEFEQLTPLADLEKQKAATEATLNILVGENCVANRKNPNRWNSCGDCPVSSIGGKAGEARPSRELSKVICTRMRYYSS